MDPQLDDVVDAIVVVAVDAVDEATHDLEESTRVSALLAAVDPASIEEVRLALAPLDHDGPARARVAAWEGAADRVLGGAVDRAEEDASLETRIWHVARRLVAEAQRARTAPGPGSLSSVLTSVAASLGQLTGTGWSAQGRLVARAPRFELRAYLDPGADLLWSSNDAARARWDYPVDSEELPIPAPLAERIATLLDRYCQSIPVRGPEVPFSPEEWSAFTAAYREIVAELSQTLGPAYVIVDDEHF